jgi:VWFA-related protein
MTRSSFGAALLLLSAATAGTAPAAQSRATQNQALASSATAILVDIVVRDRRGQPVLDLTAPDFEVSEDGVSQKVDSFTRVSRGSGIGVGVAWRSPGPSTLVTTGPGAGEVSGDSGPGDEAITALVFDHLSTESLRLAQKAALDYLPTAGESSAQIGVFTSGPGLRLMQRYTRDRALVRRAVARIAPAGTSSREDKLQRTEELLARRRGIEDETQTARAAAARTSGAAAGTASAEIGQRESERRLLQTELNMIRSFDSLDRDHQGYETSRSLLAIVESLAYAPGRKTIVFFSEGLPASPALSARLDTLIDAANRAHVTTYAIDAKGLRTRSSNDTVSKEVNAFVTERTSQLSTGSDATNEPLTMSFERVEDTFKLDSRTGLARLAEDTGGFLIEQTNDLSNAFRRIDEDTRFHYLLTYSPANTNFDGKFRSIGVKVRRPGVRVFARKGYRAIRAALHPDSASYETPALALLGRTPLPRAFPVNAAAFSFPDPARPGLTPVVLRFSTDALRFDVDAERSTYSAQAAVVVRIRDGLGREVEKLSQEYLLTGAASDLDAGKNGEIFFYREPELPSGVYTVESIVFDGKAGQGSARISTLTVPAVQPSAFDMSSLIVVNRIEEVNDPPAAAVAPPLYVGRSLIYPNLGEPIRRTAATELPFYFTLYGNLQEPNVTVQLLRNGSALAEAPLSLPPPAGPRLQHVGRLPVGAFPPGTYELRIRATDRGHEVSRAAFFTLRD